MEAYIFDKKALEWVDQIIEKLLAASLLNQEKLSAQELGELNEMISKIVHLFPATGSLPPETLIDAVRQIVEERLPEKKVMDHFPSFYNNLTATLDFSLQKMLIDQEQLLEAKAVLAHVHPEFTEEMHDETAKEEVREKELPDDAHTEISDSNNARTAEIQTAEYQTAEDQTTEDQSAEDLSAVNQTDDVRPHNCQADEIRALPETLDSETTPEIAPEIADNLDITPRTLDHSITDDQMTTPETSDFNATADHSAVDTSEQTAETEHRSPKLHVLGVDKPITDEKKFPSAGEETPAKKVKLVNSSKTQETVILQHVLSKFFPETPIHCNVTLAGHKFSAQVGNLLVFLTSSPEEAGSVTSKLEKEGWKIFCCSEGDLRFPKRIERQLRTLLRAKRS